MATKLYTEDINKHVNWAGDESTNGLPVAGEKIQQFIKETLSKKFGMIYYDKDNTATYENVDVADHTATKQYLIFADFEDFTIWASSPTDNQKLVLGSFDAPAPATIEISDRSAISNTILLSDVNNQKISFAYLIKDNNGTAQQSMMTVAVSITNSVSGTINIPTDTLNYQDNYQNPTLYTIDNIGEYLKVGTNNVTVTLTSIQFNVSTNITFQYKVLDLSISSTFGDSNAQYNYLNGIPLVDSDGNSFFNTIVTATGVGDKYLRIFVDSEQIDISGYDTDDTNDLFIGKNSPVTYEVNIPFKNRSNNFYNWATAGKHSLQMYFYIKNENNELIKSQTLYYDFVLLDDNTVLPHSYILFSRVFENNTFEGEEDTSIMPFGTKLLIETEQYLSFSTNYAVFDTAGRGNANNSTAIEIDINLINEYDEIEAEFVQNVKSGESSTFNYITSTFGDKTLQLVNTLDPEGSVEIDVSIKESEYKANVATQQMIFELTGRNRSNAEAPEKREIWSYTQKLGGSAEKVYKAEFDKVLWNSQNGWGENENCLILNNGATVTIPYDLFTTSGNGITFEIDFETTNVQDDEASIMKFGTENGSHIYINACSAELQSDNGTNIHTNYKDGARQKIAFIFGYNSENAVPEQTYDCPYLMYIVVNGILDRVAKLDKDTTYISNETSFTIGNTDGKVTTKIYSIRAYNRALRLDECVDNYIADSADFRKNYLRNDIYVDGTTNIDVNKILGKDINIPVMTIYGDITTSIVQVFNKKSNVPVDVLYQDPKFPEFNFFAHDAWMSNQGTSSMNYPRRNLRLYLNKESDAGTLRGFGSNDRYDYKTRIWYGLTDKTIITNIQKGVYENLDAPIVSGDITYTCLSNKKTLKKKPQNIKNLRKKAEYKNIAEMLMHSTISLYSDSACENKIKNFTEYISKNPDGDIYVKGAFARFKQKDLYTDRWTIKCDYAESSMCHNAGVGRLWGDVMRYADVGSSGFTYDINGDKISNAKPGSTNAQRAADAYTARTGKVFGDIRTSCDGYPIIIVNYPRKKNENNTYTEEFGDPIFLGLYNIMTDKGSTPLFGFEDLKDEEGTLIYDAGNGSQRTECWECLQNGSQLAQMSTLYTDDVDGSTVSYTSQFDEKGEFIKDTGSDNEDRPIFKTYEARWPDNDDLNETKTNKLETVIRFVNFCKDAVSVKVGEGESAKDGYTLSDFTKIDEDIAEQLAAIADKPNYKELAKEIITSLTDWNGKLYLGVPAVSYKDKTTSFYKTDSEGKVLYGSDNKPLLIDVNDSKWLYTEDNKEKGLLAKNVIYYFQDYAAQNVTGSSFSPLYESKDSIDVKKQAILAQLQSNRPYVFTESVDESEIEQVEKQFYANAGMDWYIFDNTYKRDVITKTINTNKLTSDIYTGQVYTYDGKRYKDVDRNLLHEDAWVTVYLTKNGNNYTYTNEMNQPGTRYANGNDVITEVGSGNTVNSGESFVGHTLFEYFQDKKYEHFDIWKLAAYYVYLMRFAAVDQVIKNTMMTTEDGKHYYFINYDNDTALGVRNDGYLAYDWQITRDSYDYSIGSYCYAGFGSVLWNLLEQDQDFLDKVKIMANAMVTSNVLTYDIAIDMFNNKQAGTWSERLYNNSEMYKYIGTYLDIDNKDNPIKYSPYTNTKYLPFLQGSRASHRDWWLRHRFDLYDSKWSAGEYAQDAMNFYESTSASRTNPQSIIRVVAASKFYFTVESNNRVLDGNFYELQANEEHRFMTVTNLAIGDPLKMFGAYKAKVIDLSEHRNQLGSSLEFAWPATKSSLIEELIIGGPRLTDRQITIVNEDGQEETLDSLPAGSLGKIVGLEKLQALRVLDVRTNNFANDSLVLNISSLGNLTKFLATGSNISEFSPAQGAMFTGISLPSAIRTIKMNNITINPDYYTEEDAEVIAGNKNVGDIKFAAFDYTPNQALSTVEIKNIDGTGFNLLEFLIKWYNALKKNGTKVSTCSCDLEFNTIVLPEFIGDENGEEVTDINEYSVKLRSNEPVKMHSLNWLNALKNDFGINSNGEPNLKMKGTIKLYGHAEDTLYSDLGGLTQDDLDLMKQSVYTNTQINLWDSSAFGSDSAFHFDANKSVFVDVSGNKKYYSQDSSGIYNVVAGQTLTITATIFPINYKRVITFTPLTSSGLDIHAWEYDTVAKAYKYNYNDGLKYTYLTVNGNTATLSCAEYTSSVTRNVAINISDNLNGGTDIANLTFNITQMIRPNEDSYKLVYEGADSNPSGDTSRVINTVELHSWSLEYAVDNINVDINKVDASFNYETIDNNNDFGRLYVVSNYDAVNDVTNYKIQYLPIIQNISNNTDSIVNIYTHITLADQRHTVVKKELRISLTTKLVTSIGLTQDVTGNPIGATLNLDDNKYIIENYVKELNGERSLVYNYSIQLNTVDNIEDFNVGIKSMEFIKSSVPEFSINPSQPDENNIIKSFNITVPTTIKSSIYRRTEFTIKVVDVFDHEITRTVSVIIGCFYPDEVRLLTKVGTDQYVADMTKVNVLKTDTPAINYDLHIYSIINGERYVWGYEDDVVSRVYNDELTTTTHFLGNKIPTKGGNSGYTASNITTNIAETNLPGHVTGNRINIDNDDHYISFTLITETNIENSIWTINFNVAFNVTFNGRQTSFNKDCSIARSAAIAINGNWQSNALEVLPDDANSTSVISTDTLAKGIYFMDNELRIYDNIGLNQSIGQIGDPRNIHAIIIKYNSSNDVNYVALDPWQISDEIAWYWWKSTSTYAHDTNYGLNFVETQPFLNLFEENAYSDIIENYNTGQIFEKFYDYYRLVCYNSNNTIEDNMGKFIFTTESNEIIEQNHLNNETENTRQTILEQLAILLRNGQIKFTQGSEITENANSKYKIIYSNINYYKNKGMSNIICKPLSADDIQVIMTNFNYVGAFLDYFDEIVDDSGIGKMNFKTKLFDTTDPNKYHIDSVTNEQNDLYTHNVAFTTVNDYNVVDKSKEVNNTMGTKFFWFFEKPPVDSHYTNTGWLQNAQVAIVANVVDTHSANNINVYPFRYSTNADSNNNDYLLQSFYGCYCLWGPELGEK